MNQLFEHGFLPFYRLKLAELLTIRIKQKLPYYETVEEFVDDVSRNFSLGVKLDNIANLLLYFGTFLGIVLLVFILDFVLIRLHKINLKLIRCLTIFAQKMLFRRSTLCLEF